MLQCCSMVNFQSWKTEIEAFFGNYRSKSYRKTKKHCFDQNLFDLGPWSKGSVDWVYNFFFVFESVFNCLLIVLVLGCDNNRLPKYWWWKTFLTCLYKNFFENQSFSSGNAENLSNFIILSKKGGKNLQKRQAGKCAAFA